MLIWGVGGGGNRGSLPVAVLALVVSSSLRRGESQSAVNDSSRKWRFLCIPHSGQWIELRSELKSLKYWPGLCFWGAPSFSSASLAIAQAEKCAKSRGWAFLPAWTSEGPILTAEVIKIQDGRENPNRCSDIPKLLILWT